MIECALTDLQAPPGSAAHERAVAAVGRAGRSLGAFALGEDEVMGEARSALLALCREFFALPAATKLRYAPSPDNPRGYHAVPDAGDMREKFLLTRLQPQALGEQSVESGGPLAGSNHEIVEIVDFSRRLEQVLTPLCNAGLAVLEAMATDLSVAPQAFTAPMLAPGGGAAVWLLHYPPQAAPVGLDGKPKPGQGTSAHRDLHPLTLIVQDDVGGLEVHDGQRWHLTDPARYPVVCQMGEVVARWTNGAYTPNVHRVRSPEANSRYSVAIFLQPAMDTVIGPLVGSGAQEASAVYPPQTFAAIMEAWFEAIADGSAGYADVGGDP